MFSSNEYKDTGKRYFWQNPHCAGKCENELFFTAFRYRRYPSLAHAHLSLRHAVFCGLPFFTHALGQTKGGFFQPSNEYRFIFS